MVDLVKITVQEENDTFGRFVVEPLVQGYGQTIGNSLRRVLLSSLGGAAITAVKISGVSHQFSAISGVKEDVAELLLNLKQVRLSMSGKDSAKITLSQKGEGDINASQIKTVAGVEVVNPDLYIAHLSGAKSKLDIEMTVEKGYGYALSDERPQTEVGVIALDALFSPVVRVNYKVEATRVGRRTDFDKLTMEIFTDGTIGPSEALKEAAKTLVSYFTIFYQPQSRPVVVSDEGQIVSSKNDETASLTIEELDVPARIVNALRAAKIETVGDLTSYQRKDLLKIKNLGAKSLSEVEKKLKEREVQLP
ncbi:DNA-directed RNA polymerase subunit alpha [Candidatus Daviesbacteria bacterium]|nr:DNA-directed RNA polymerase subunit alpha [Candidatus Daviesbacteria bacterium]